MSGASDELERARGARLALVREELVGPITAIRGYQEIVLEAATRNGLSHMQADLGKLACAVEALATYVETLLAPDRDAAQEGVPEEGLIGLEARLRHDLRTPLNAVMGYCELVLEDLEDEAAALRPDLEQLLGEARKLLAEVDRIVDLSRGDRSERVDELASRIADQFVRSMPGPSMAGNGLQGTILVVDDNASNRDVLCRRLEHDGHKASAAPDALTALRLLDERAFDVVLLDLLMPDVNGYELLMRIKSEPRWRELPVIMISGLQERESSIRCIEAGADDFLEKPVNPVLLRARLNACLERKSWQDRERRYLSRLAEEKARVDELLENILPRRIIARLQNGEDFIADGVEAATVLFCDIVGFTQLATALRPAVVVDGLNRLFSAFDRLADELGVEKIKTVGDAYLAASGLPEPRPDHAAIMAEFALRLLDVVDRHNVEGGLPLRVRIGMHTGPVIAGIIGKHKFVYDIWGDTVNIASRLESQGLEGRIQISEATAKALGAAFVIEPRATIELRGRGPMQTFVLRGHAGT